MAIYYRNANIGVRLPVGQTSTEPEVERHVHIQDASATVAYEMFGVEEVNTKLIFDDPDGFEYYKAFGRVTWNGKEYAILVKPKLWDQVALASHIEVLIQEIQGTSPSGDALPPR